MLVKRLQSPLIGCKKWVATGLCADIDKAFAAVDTEEEMWRWAEEALPLRLRLRAA